jgi:hypothetical protein
MVIEREPVPVAIIQVAVFAMEGKIGAFPADSTACVKGVLFLSNNSENERSDFFNNFHEG